MLYPFTILTPSAHASATHYRTPTAVEHPVVQSLRAGQPWVGVIYLRRPLVLFVAPGREGDVPDISGWAQVVTVPEAVMLKGEAAFNARREAWIAAGSPTLKNGDPILPRLGTPIKDAIEAEVAKLGDSVKPLPRGKARQAVFRILTEQGMNEDRALATMELINGYLK